MRKLLFLILVLSLNLYGANVSLQTIGDNADIISSPLRNNFNILQNAFNKGINASNITNGSISYDLLGKPLLKNSTEFNATVSDNSINLSKANTDWFNVNYPIYKNTSGLDINVDLSYFDKTTTPGTLGLVNDSVDGSKIDLSSVAGNGLSSDTANDVLDVNVDNVSILIENDSLVLGRINISGDTSVENDTHINYAIQTGGETLLTNDTSSIINAINSNKQYTDDNLQVLVNDTEMILSIGMYEDTVVQTAGFTATTFFRTKIYIKDNYDTLNLGLYIGASSTAGANVRVYIDSLQKDLNINQTGLNWYESTLDVSSLQGQIVDIYISLTSVVSGGTGYNFRGFYLYKEGN